MGIRILCYISESLVFSNSNICYVSIYVCAYVFTTVISEPDDATVCEGRSTAFTCVLDSHTGGQNAQWYRRTKDRDITEIVDQLGSSSFTTTDSTINNRLTINLTITNVRKSYTGYYWVGTSVLNACNASLTVTTSM